MITSLTTIQYQGGELIILVTRVSILQWLGRESHPDGTTYKILRDTNWFVQFEAVYSGAERAIWLPVVQLRSCLLQVALQSCWAAELGKYSMPPKLWKPG